MQIDNYNDKIKFISYILSLEDSHEFDSFIKIFDYYNIPKENRIQ